MKKILSLLFLFAISIVNSQTKEQAEQLIENYNISEIKLLRNKLFEKQTAEYNRAVEWAKANNWPLISYLDDGGIEEIYKLGPNGLPLYRKTDNVAAAISTRTNFLNAGGGLGLNLDGQNMTARIWDGGTVRRTHNGFGGRVETIDDSFGTSYSQHATHVTGTIIASPWNSTSLSIKGMASLAVARTFNWTNDESEALDEVLEGMLVSNHSYGVPVTNNGNTLPSWYIGSYVQDSRNWDEITYLAPYYLPVFSAGNGGNNNDNADPIAFGYDKLVGDKVSKNVLTVANAQDATINPNGTLSNVQINSSSSQGPTDDRRIKPDITGNGTGVLSLAGNGDSFTANLSGTSMSAPNVTGTLLLLQQYHADLTNSFMKAATLKGLACHTADDAGQIGPDPVFGWGLLNAKKAAETLRDNGLNSWVSENTLNQGGTYTMTVSSDGGVNNPLIASVTWTDLPGEANNGQREANDLFRSLVNDLDIRISRNNTTFFPWKLQNDPSLPAVRNGDNNVDNVEIIKIDNPIPGEYIITISHKGNLFNGKQDYGLVLTGIKSNFAIIPKSPDLTICNTSYAVYTFDYKQIGTGTTFFSATGVPAGANVAFSTSSLSFNGTVTMTISNLNNALPGSYDIGILGNNGTETETRFRKLNLYSPNHSNVVLNSPSNSQIDLAPTVILAWEEQFNATFYNVQVATDVNFNNIISSVTTDETTFTVAGLSQNTNHYWRVNPINQCGSGTISNATVNMFKTATITCGIQYVANDFSTAFIGDTANSEGFVPIEITGNHIIGNMTVTMDISHTYIQDLIVTLEGPESIGSPIITLFNEACGSQDDIVCTVSDNGIMLTCNQTSPGISGTVIPFDNLSSIYNFNANGTWILRAFDSWNGDGGVINSASINLCGINQTSLSNNYFELNTVSVYPNPSKGIINVNLGENLAGETTYVLYDVQGRIVMNKKSNATMETLNVENVSNGVYLLSIENGTAKTTQKIIINK
jgi:subtilisin-like proprotein convertase family protein